MTTGQPVVPVNTRALGLIVCLLKTAVAFFAAEAGSRYMAGAVDNYLHEAARRTIRRPAYGMPRQAMVNALKAWAYTNIGTVPSRSNTHETWEPERELN